MSSLARRVALAAVTVTLLAGATVMTTAAAPAVAGTYHLYSCTQPDSQRAPTDGWWGQATGPSVRASNTCANGGYLFAIIDGGPAQPVGAAAGWVFSVPWFDSIRAATLWRSYVSTGAGTSAQTAAYMSAPSDSFDSLNAFDVCPAVGCRYAGSSSGSRFAPANRVVVPLANLNGATHIYVNAGCVGSPGASCPEGSTVDASMRAADITLAVNTAPSASAVGGSLTTNEKLNGPQDIQITASDSGPGIYQALFQIDGTTVEKQVIDTNEGRCQDAGQTTDGDAAFLYVQPCPAQVNAADASFDPSAVSDGPHQLRVLVNDAAGDTTTILNHSVVVDNNGAYSTLVARGACNGTTCDDHARLVSNTKLRASFTRPLGGSSLTLTGSLVDHTGAPISGAQVQLLEQPNEQGAAITEMASVSSHEDGRWAFHVPAGPCRLLRVAYYSHMKDPTPAARLDYHERVPAAVSLHAPNHVHTGRPVVFYGHLAGSYVPRQGEPVKMEILYAGRWRTIEVLNTDRHGRWAYRYLFSIGGGSYLFRAVALANAGYPFLAGHSRPVRIRVQA
jgi:hypothetical protein